jgi:hypothetical protein
MESGCYELRVVPLDRSQQRGSNGIEFIPITSILIERESNSPEKKKKEKKKISISLTHHHATPRHSIWHHSNRAAPLYPTVPLPPNHCHSPCHCLLLRSALPPIHRHFFIFANFPKNRHISLDTATATVIFPPFEPHCSPLSTRATATQPLPLCQPR